VSERLRSRAAAVLLCIAVFAVLRLIWGGQQPPGKRYPASSYPGFDHEAHLREHMLSDSQRPMCFDAGGWVTIAILDDDDGRYWMTEAILTDQP
jgi:hypothetical protein